MSPRNAAGCISPVHNADAQFTAIYPIVRRVSGARWARAAWQFSKASIDRQDLEQETLSAAWSAFRHYDPRRASTRTFLERVAAARIASLARTARRHPRCENIETCLLLAPDSIPALELRIDVRSVLEVLAPLDRELAMLLMHHSPAETARVLNVSRPVVYRGIQRIRSAFEGAGFRTRYGCQMMPHHAAVAVRAEGESQSASATRTGATLSHVKTLESGNVIAGSSTAAVMVYQSMQKRKEISMKENSNGNNSGADRFLIFQTPIEKTREILSTNHGETGVDPSELRRIKLPAGGATLWTLPTLTGEETAKELTCIILNSQDLRKYWKVGMEVQANAPPDCYSTDGFTGVGNPGGQCSRCPHSHFGPSGESPACKEMRELAVLQENELLPDIISLPRTSKIPSGYYAARLSSRRLSWRSVVTTIGLEKMKNGQGIVYSRATFTAGDVLTPEQEEIITRHIKTVKPSPTPAVVPPEVKEIAPAEGEEL
jgi:RNA polymerase sigma factor (sigma-70 family)